MSIVIEENEQIILDALLSSKRRILHLSAMGDDLANLVEKAVASLENGTKYQLLRETNYTDARKDVWAYQPDLVIIDGYNIDIALEAAESIKKLNPNTNIRLITQDPSNQKFTQAYCNDIVDDILQTPETPEILARQIKDILSDKPPKQTVTVIGNDEADYELIKKKLIHDDYPVIIMGDHNHVEIDTTTYFSIDVSKWARPGTGDLDGRRIWAGHRQFISDLELSRLNLYEFGQLAELMPHILTSDRGTYGSIMHWASNLTRHEEEQKLLDTFIDTIWKVYRDEEDIVPASISIPRIIPKMLASQQSREPYLHKLIEEYQQKGNTDSDNDIIASILTDIISRNELKYLLNVRARSDVYSFLRREDLKRIPQIVNDSPQLVEIDNYALAERILVEEIEELGPTINHADYSNNRLPEIQQEIMEGQREADREKYIELYVQSVRNQLKMMPVRSFVSKDTVLPIPSIHYVVKRTFELPGVGSFVMIRKVFEGGDSVVRAAEAEHANLESLIREGTDKSQYPIVLGITYLPGFTVVDMQSKNAPTLYDRINGKWQGRNLDILDKKVLLAYLANAQYDLIIMQELGYRRFLRQLEGEKDQVLQRGIAHDRYVIEIGGQRINLSNLDKFGRSKYFTNELDAICLKQFEAYTKVILDDNRKKSFLRSSTALNKILQTIARLHPKHDTDGNPRNVLTYDDGKIGYLDFHFYMVECGLKDWVKQWQNGLLFHGKEFEKQVLDIDMDYSAWDKKVPKIFQTDDYAGFKDKIEKAAKFLYANNYISDPVIEANLIDRGLILQTRAETQTALQRDYEAITDKIRKSFGIAPSQYLENLLRMATVENPLSLNKNGFFSGKEDYFKVVNKEDRNLTYLAYATMSTLVHEFYIGYEARNMARAKTSESRQSAYNRLLYHQLWAKVNLDVLIHTQPDYFTVFFQPNEILGLDAKDVVNIKNHRKELDYISVMIKDHLQ
ncbi:MAG: hypothetical protein ABIC04_07480 [Nanoarchaeota archaeon]